MELLCSCDPLCMHVYVVSFRCIQWMGSKESDRIVWLLGWVFVNAKETTLAVTFMPSHWLQSPEH